MREKTKLKKFFFMPVTACDAIKEELEAMALKGWKLKRMGVMYEFEKIPPKKLFYTVDFFPQASIYDTEPSEDATDYIEYCREAGWELVDMNGTMHIFVSENEAAVPIHTDEKLKLEATSKSMLKTYWFTWFLWPLYLALSILFFDLQSLVTSNMSLCSMIISVGLLVLLLSDFFGFLYWRIKNKKRIKNGEKIKFIGLKTSRKIFAIKISFAVVIFLLIPLLFSVASKNWACASLAGLALFSTVFFIFTDNLLGKFKASAGTNIFVAFIAVILAYIVSFFVLFNIEEDVRPDTVKPTDNFAFADSPNYTYTVHLDKSILASEERVSVDCGDESVFYYITFKSNSHFIMEKYYNEYYKTGYSDMPQEKESWNAKEVLINDRGSCLTVVYDNAIIQFNGQTDFTEEQKSDIAEKLTKSEDGFLPLLLSVNGHNR